MKFNYVQWSIIAYFIIHVMVSLIHDARLRNFDYTEYLLSVFVVLVVTTMLFMIADMLPLTKRSLGESSHKKV